MKRFVLLLLVVMLLVPLAVTAQEEVTLTVRWFASAACDRLATLSAAYEAASVEVICTPYPEWQGRVFEDFAAGTGADLVMLDSQWLGEAVAGGYLLDLTDWMADALPLDDFAPAMLSAYGEYPPASGAYYGVPFQPDALILLYRRDYFEDAAYQAAFEAEYGYPLAVPATWDHLLDAARFFYRPDEGMYGFATGWDGSRSSDVITANWNPILWSLGGALWQPESCAVAGVLNDETGHAALELAQQLYQTAPPGASIYSFAEVNEAVCSHETALAVNWFGDAAATTDAMFCENADNLGYAVMPGQDAHYTSLGGVGITVAASSEYPQAAQDYLAWLLSDDVQQEWAQGGGFSPRLSILGDAAYQELTPYNALALESVPLLHDYWNLPEYADLLAPLQEYLSLAITGGMDAQEALDAIAAAQQAVLADAYGDDCGFGLTAE
ncbi:MAG: extracellular solute-binding protein [Anaerolineae bacterium]|nr:extracellular solute-binding protein [Anaerolineae bacterium]